MLVAVAVVFVQVFAPFVAGGFLEFVYGGAEVGQHCTHHPLVDSVHLTGSEATYNNIKFGTPKVQVRLLCSLRLVMLWAVRLLGGVAVWVWCGETRPC